MPRYYALGNCRIYIEFISLYDLPVFDLEEIISFAVVKLQTKCVGSSSRTESVHLF